MSSRWQATSTPGPSTAERTDGANPWRDRAAVASLDAPAGTYNVADDNPLRFRENLAAMTAAIGARPLRRLPSFTGPLAMGSRHLTGGAPSRAAALPAAPRLRPR